MCWGVNSRLRRAIAKRSWRAPYRRPTGFELDGDLVQAIDNLAQGKRPFGLAGMFGKIEAKRQLESITVNGHAPVDAGDWQHVSAFVALQRKWRELSARWNALAPDLGLEQAAADGPAGGVAAATQFAFYRKVQTLAAAETALVEQAVQLFPRWTLGRRVAEDLAALAQLEQAISHHLTTDRLGSVWAVRERLQKPLEGRTGRIIEDIRAFLTDVLGNPKVGRIRDVGVLVGHCSRNCLACPCWRMHLPSSRT